MDYTRSFTLDVNASTDMKLVRVKQGDASTRFLAITLTKDGVPYTPESGVAAMFRCEKPDGHAVMYDSAHIDTDLNRYLVIIGQNGLVTVELTEQVMAVVGRCKCDLCLFNGNLTLSTIPFIIDVKASPNVASTAISTNDFRTLTNALAEVEEIKETVLDEDFIELVDEIKGLGDVTKLIDNVATLTLSTSWSGSGPYTQSVTIAGYTVTANTRVDLVCDSTAIDAMIASGTTNIYVSNNNGTLTAYAIGSKPTVSITVQAVISETRSV